MFSQNRDKGEQQDVGPSLPENLHWLVKQTAYLRRTLPVLPPRAQEKPHPYEKQWVSGWLHQMRGHQTTQGNQSSLGAIRSFLGEHQNLVWAATTLAACSRVFT